jgi:hypothetical protein
LPSARTGVAAARLGGGTAARIELVGGGSGDNHLEFQPASGALPQWDTIPFPAGFRAEIGVRTGKSIWGTAPSDLFVVGTAQNPARGAVLHWDGNRWTEQAGLPGDALVSISGSAAGGVFAVSPTVILKRDGSRWVQVPGPVSAGTFVRYAGLWTAPTGVAFLGGGVAPGAVVEPLLARFNDTRWVTMSASGFGEGFAELWDLSGSSAADVWTVGRKQKCADCDGTNAVVARRQGPSWTVVFEQANAEYRGIAAVGASDVWVAGMDSEGDALTVHWNGSAWRPAAPLSTPELGLNDIWASSGSDVYAVGPGGLLHYDGRVWSKVPGVRGDRLFGTSSHDIFVVQATQLVRGRR